MSRAWKEVINPFIPNAPQGLQMFSGGRERVNKNLKNKE